MTLEPSDKRSLSEVRQAKADEFLADARAAHAEGRFRTAVNRAYYAVLSAARALLVLVGDSPRSHEGVMTMLSLRLVKPGAIPVEVLKSIKLLSSRRLDVDYGDFDAIDQTESAASIEAAERVLGELGAVRVRLLTESES